MSGTGRPPIRIGELGSVTTTKRGQVWQARGRTRTGAGELVRIASSGDSEAEARPGLAAKARKLGFKVNELSDATNLGALLALWLAEKRRSGKAKERSLLVYERHIGYLNAAGGAVSIGDLDAGRVQALLDHIWEQRSLAAARKCASVLRGAFALAVRRRALPRTPMESLEPLPTAKGPSNSLTVDQVRALREAIRRREARIKGRFRSDTPNLRLVVELLLASGLRVSEAVALRHRDVDLDAGTISVSRTLIVAPGGAVVEESLKGSGQERVIALPAFGVAALREARSRCQTVSSRLPDKPAVQSAAGTWVLPRNLRRGSQASTRTPSSSKPWPRPASNRGT